MPEQTDRYKLSLKALGISSPYIAVIAGVFWLKNGFGAILFYHAILLICILGINKSNTFGLLHRGFHRFIGPIICWAGLLPGILILFLWPIAHRHEIELSGIFERLSLSGNLFIFFMIYACFTNPILEESFWRGCFKNETLWPNTIDACFAGYHALAVFPVMKAPFVLSVFLVMTFTGWLFRSLYRLTGGLLLPLLIHIIADIAILLSVWKLTQ